jgi:hypothetical protein|tara:strand:+ start:532 stop:681 length:150 start_codon:yes stop_codon:yes gene_type:complete
MEAQAVVEKVEEVVHVSLEQQELQILVVAEAVLALLMVLTERLVQEDQV